MKIIERQGKSASRITEDFMKEFNLKLDNFKFEVIEEGSSGIFGMFSNKPAKVKFYLPDISENIKTLAEGLLNRLNVSYLEIKVSFNDNAYTVEILGTKDPGFIIGKEAKLLNSIQYILNQMTNKQEKKHLIVRVDVNGYRNRRKEALISKVKNIAEKVKENGKSITLEPLHAANRRIVHQFIEKDSKVKTKTIGDGEFKRVVILPAGRNKTRHGSERAN